MSILFKNSNNIKIQILRISSLENYNFVNNMQQNYSHTQRPRHLDDEDNSKDYWRVLGLSEKSDQEQVRQAYLKLAKRYHPDSGSPEASSSKFQKIDDAYQNLQKKFADERHNRHKIEGEYGLYYEAKKGLTKKPLVEKANEEDGPDIRHTAPQHRQYLSFDGIGHGSPAQREKQYQTYRTAKVSENLLNHRIGKLEASADVMEIALRKNTQASNKIKTGIGIERLVEDLIQESMARGDFENLSGKGKPLKHDPSTHHPYIDFTTHKLNQMLIDNGFAPEWILLEKEIREEMRALKKVLLTHRHTHYGPGSLSASDEQHWRAFLAKAEFKKDCDELNSKINKYNLVVPSLFKQIVCFQVEREAKKAIEYFSEELWSSCQLEKKKCAERRALGNSDRRRNENDAPSLIETIVSLFKLS